MTSHREDQEEKLRVLLQDVRRDKPDTFHSRAETEYTPGSEVGRFAHLSRVEVTGGVPRYPRQPSSSPWASDPLGPEMPIDGSDCSDTYIGEPIGTSAEIEASSALSLPCAQTGPTINENLQALGGGATN